MPVRLRRWSRCWRSGPLPTVQVSCPSPSGTSGGEAAWHRRRSSRSGLASGPTAARHRPATAGVGPLSGRRRRRPLMRAMPGGVKPVVTESGRPHARWSGRVSPRPRPWRPQTRRASGASERASRHRQRRRAAVRVDGRVECAGARRAGPRCAVDATPDRVSELARRCQRGRDRFGPASAWAWLVGSSGGGAPQALVAASTAE